MTIHITMKNAALGIATLGANADCVIKPMIVSAVVLSVVASLIQPLSIVCLHLQFYC